jgi:dTDP-4-amino-4,6-dideoxygalactose transaminase
VAHNLNVGELGCVNTNNKKIRNLVRQIKSNGRLCTCDICTRGENKCPQESNDDPRFTHNILGYNFRANEFSTAIANVRLKEMDEINKKRRFNIKYLNEGLSKYKDVLELPIFSDDVSYLGYPLVIKKGSRKDLTTKLELKGIETRSLYGCIPLQQPSYEDLKKEYEGKLPNAEYLGKNGLYIGCHQYLSISDLDYVIKSFDEVLDGI